MSVCWAVADRLPVSLKRRLQDELLVIADSLPTGGDFVRTEMLFRDVLLALPVEKEAGFPEGVKRLQATRATRGVFMYRPPSPRSLSEALAGGVAVALSQSAIADGYRTALEELAQIEDTDHPAHSTAVATFLNAHFRDFDDLLLSPGVLRPPGRDEEKAARRTWDLRHNVLFLREAVAEDIYWSEQHAWPRGPVTTEAKGLVQLEERGKARALALISDRPSCRAESRLINPDPE